KELIQVYRLQNIDSKSAVDIASTVMADQLKRIALDTRSNSIIVQANEKGHEAFAELLKTIDQPQPSLDQIKMVDAGEFEASVVRNKATVIQSMLPQIEIAFSDSNLILRGSEQDLEVAESLLARLTESSKPKPDARNLVIEVRWLREDENAKADETNGELSQKLSARGFKPLSTVALLETRIPSSGKFTCDSNQSGSILNIEGDVRTVEGGLEVELKANAAAPPSVDLAFASSYFAKTDQWLVFGVAQGKESAQSKTGRDIILVRIKNDLSL
ncbi:MAG: secretin N-terminal domain-containing protein, partial [Planctomycetota bacterium]